jgi:uncharacterized protein YndB with AHSA1/START domain
MQTASGSEVVSPNRTVVERRSERELVVTRTFDAAAHLVWLAWTTPELLKRWWAPRSLGVSLYECENDLRVGGRYRYVFGRDPKQPMVFTGEYSDVTPPARLVFTQIFEPMRHMGAAIVTVTLEERGAKTHLTVHQLHPSKEALDGAVASGMEKGMRETYEQLEALVATLR